MYVKDLSVPHTKQQIQQLLRTADISPRHRWGQNFLVDLNLMRLLVGTAELKGNETVLEIGCGTGSLTGLLAESAGAVVAVEIDRSLIHIAKSESAQFDNITFVEGDALASKSVINPCVLDCINCLCKRLRGPFYLIANLPYQAASPLIVNLLLDTNIPDAMFVTIQTEVAERMIAEPGRKTYGMLSILMQSTGNVTKIRDLPPQAFWPSPRVQSTMIAWRRDDKKYRSVADMKLLKQTVDLLLGHRRKKIRNCISDGLKNTDQGLVLRLLREADIDPDARGETVSPEKFVQLANLWAKL